ncbi:uncharacterized protein PG998_011571 [Apiospora kogelbergensis]|uniref:uncharacterized protein n=1 Tax=Apiospora kogelbergensis TaxID=1337665 RepID=UPI003131D315
MTSYGDVRQIMRDIYSLVKYGNTVCNSAKERNALCQEIIDLQSVMDRVRGAWDRVKSDDQDLFNHTQVQMEHCFSDLKELLQMTPKGFQRFAIAFGWPLKKPEIEKALNDIRGYRNALTAIMVADTRELVADVPATIQRNRILEFIKSYTPKVSTGHFQVSVPLMHAPDEVGKWFLEEEKFLTWAESDKGLLWVKGSAGCGKSGLAYVTSSRMAEGAGNPDNYDVACVFCHHASLQTLQDPMDIIMSLWIQLVHSGSRLDYQFVDEFEKRGRMDHISAKELTQRKMEIFQHTATQAPGVILVLDGLDEVPWNFQRDVVNYLREIQQHCPKLRLMITSRPYKSIGDMFVDDPTFELETASSDLKLYILGRMKSEGWMWSEEWLVEELIPRCDGFLMCKLFMDEVMRAQTRTECSRVINNLPKTIQEALKRVIARLAEERNGSTSGDPACLAIQALFWVAFAKRPMTQSQLRQALAVTHNALDHDKHGRQQYDNEEEDLARLDLVRMCGELIIINNGDKTLRVIHKSVADYLVTSEVRDLWFPNILDQIPTSLLQFLHLDRMKEPVEGTSTEDFMKNNPLCPYALEVWGLDLAKTLRPDTSLWILAETTLKESIHEWNDHVKSQAVEALVSRVGGESYNPIVAMVRCRPGDVTREWFGPGTITGLHWAVVFDLPMFIPSLSKIPEPNKPVPTTPLGIAAMLGRDDLANCLIDNGSKINIHQDIDWAVRPPLHDAVWLCQGTTISLLLEKGADLTQRRGRFDQSPLDIAFEIAVEMTMQANWIVNHPVPTRAQELQFLVRRGNVDEINEAIEKGLDVNHPCENGKMALDYAQEMGHKEIAGILKRRGAKSNFVWPAIMDGPSPRPLSHPVISTMTPIVWGHESWKKCRVVSGWPDYLHRSEGWSTHPHRKLLIEIPIPEDIEVPIRSIVFETDSMDQGWSDYRHLHGTYIATHGSRFEVCFHHPDGDSESFVLQTNLHGSEKPRLHTNIWNLSELEVSSPRRADLIKNMRHPGSLQVFGHAEKQGWENRVSSVRVRMYGTEVGAGHQFK